MRSLTLFITLFTFSLTNIFGQEITESDALSDWVSIMADELCSCGIEKSKEKTLAEVDITMCLLPAIEKYGDQLESLGFTVSDKDSMSKLGEMIGMKAAFNCPEIFEGLIEEEVNEEEVTEEEEYVTYTGEVKKVVVSDLIKVYIKVDGKTQLYLWLSEVDTNIDVFEGFEQLKSKKVEFTVYEASLFDTKVKDYRDFFLFNSLNVIE